jgi:endonuclease YncB( thermonuclease family)
MAVQRQKPREVMKAVVQVDVHFPRQVCAANARRLVGTSEGETPHIEQPVRLVSCDMPETSIYAGAPQAAQQKLDACRARLENGFYDALPEELRSHLLARLSPDAAKRHIAAGHRAASAFNELLDLRLALDGGGRRRLATIPTGEIIDTHGRLLAYLAPWFAGDHGDPLPPRDHPDRRTFNLDLIERGWAAFFPVYPSLPRHGDLNRTIAAAESAWDEKRGAFAEFGDDLLLGYEYRACVKLGTADDPGAGIAAAFKRVCVDLRDLRVVGLFGFPEVPPCYRLWIWRQDLDLAMSELGLHI